MDVFTISRLNQCIKRTLEREFILKNCFVAGTISNLKRHSAGHYYFTLKDEEAAIDVALWSSTAQRKGLVGKLENGLLVTMRAAVNFYEKTGRLSLICNDLQVGTKSPYQMAFEELKRELESLGYFAEEHKKPLPRLASCIGIVTSQSGAVLHDILHVAKQRNPLVRFKLYAVPVQGESAGAVIAKGVSKADADPDVDLIIVGRGGGSMEDLWCFNDRAVVEAVYACHTPIISAVGHETDYTLCDFAADVRGATPSHAAEMAVYPLASLQNEVAAVAGFLHTRMTEEVESRRQQLFALFNRKLGVPALTLIHREQSRLDGYTHQLHTSVKRGVDGARKRLIIIAQRLEANNPLAPLLKGYAKAEAKGVPVTSISQVAGGDTLTVHVSDGTITTIVKEVKANGSFIEKL